MKETLEIHRGPNAHLSAPEAAHERLQAALTEVCPFALLHADVHARKKGSADERDLVNDQQKYVLPSIL